MNPIETAPALSHQTVAELREHSRKLVRELGFMRTTLAGSNLVPSAVHAIIEIGQSPGMHAQKLSTILKLDKSNTSRQLAKLEAAGLITRKPAGDDGRSWELHLTRAGRALRDKIDRFASEQVSSALQHLAPAEQQNLVRALSLYTKALALGNDGGAPQQEDTSREAQRGIHRGYVPGCIGDIASLHARYYSRMAGFGVYFEKKVATGVAEFAAAMPSDDKALWLYVDSGRVLASIAIDGDRSSGRAHLRWFIVDESLQGQGIGRRLLALALDFADQRFANTYLWTFRGLDAARHLYESSGFKLVEETKGTQWGAPVIEQRFERRA